MEVAYCPSASVKQLSMNSNGALGVAGALIAVWSMTGCVDVNGGAVELSWTIQDSRGERRGCDDGPLDVVRLHGLGPEGATWVSDDASCAAHRLASRFQIEPGRWTFALETVCASTGQVADVQVPDPIARDIVNGQVAQLNALLIVIKTGRGSCRVPADAAPALDAGPPDATAADAAVPLDATPFDTLPLEKNAL